MNLTTLDNNTRKTLRSALTATPAGETPSPDPTMMEPQPDLPRMRQSGPVSDKVTVDSIPVARLRQYHRVRVSRGPETYRFHSLLLPGNEGHIVEKWLDEGLDEDRPAPPWAWNALAEEFGPLELY